MVWLKNNNNCYKDIEIDLRAIDALQENSILADLPTVTTDCENFSEIDDTIPCDENKIVYNK